MLRPRLPATILTAALSAATFDLVPAAPVEKAREKEKAYSVVGQSTESTAATGRKPLAKRIAAANQPIRTAGPDWQGPQVGNGTLVIAPLADSEGRPADDAAALPAVAPEPGRPVSMEALTVEVPLPTADVDPAIAAPGRVAEPPLVATLPATPAIDPAPSAEWTSAVIASSDPVPGDTAPAETGSATSPQPVAPTIAARRIAAVPRVQERLTTEEGVSATPLLDRVRSTLTRLPRPLGLIPAPHTAASQPPQSQHSHTRHRGAVRTTGGTAAPLAAADGPAIDQPAALPSASGEPSSATSDTASLAVVEPAADDRLTGPATATPEAAEEVADAAADAAADVTPATETAVETLPDADAAPVMAAESDPASADTALCDCETGDPAPVLAAETAPARSDPIPQPAARAATAHRAHAAHRVRADQPTPAPAREALAERLRTAFARMQRPLGLVPMPAGTTAHGVRPTPRQPAIAASQSVRPGAAGTPGGIAADSRAVAAQDQAAGDAVLTAGERTTAVVETADGRSAAAESPAAAPTTGTPSLLDETGAIAAAGSPTIAGSTERSPQRPAQRHAGREAPAPRTVRDHLQAAFAGMPRPLGLLPAPATAAHGAPTAGHRQPHAHRAPASRKAATGAVATGTAAAGTGSMVAPASGSLPLDGTPSATTAAATEAFGPAPIHDADAPATGLVESVERVISNADTPAPAAPQVVTMQIEGLPDASQTGEPFDLTITIHNGSSQPLANVVATVFFDEGIEPVSAGNWPVRLAPGVIAFDAIETLAAGETVSLPIRAVGVAAGDTAFRVTLDAAEMDDALTADGILSVATPSAP